MRFLNHARSMATTTKAPSRVKWWGAGVGVAGLGGYLLGRGTKPLQLDTRELSVKTKALDMAASFTQHFKPISKIHQHVCGFHFYSDNLQRQVPAHHYCSCLSDEMRQCVRTLR